MAAAITQPEPGRLYGITHLVDGTPVIREPKLLKVSIGCPKGKAIMVYIGKDGLWKVQVGAKKEAKAYPFEKREQAEEFYQEQYEKAPAINYPRKLNFFSFSRPMADGNFEPDFAAIEAHGPMPTEIDICFLGDAPLDLAYQMWSSAELRCKGDGLRALRVLSMATDDAEKKLAAEAEQTGEKYFPVNKCWTGDCQYAGDQCKPGADLKFQLAKNIRVGSTAYFHSTGIRSAQQLHTSLTRFRALTGGRLVGVICKMVMRPYRTKHKGQIATQYGVSLEFRAEDLQALQQQLTEQVMTFRGLAAPAEPQPALTAAAPEESTTIIEPDDGNENARARAMAAEFYPDATDEEGSTDEVLTKTTSRTDELRGRLAQQKIERDKSKVDPEADGFGVTDDDVDAILAAQEQNLTQEGATTPEGVDAATAAEPEEQAMAPELTEEEMRAATAAHDAKVGNTPTNLFEFPD